LKSWELRAATSLLMRDQGRTREAYDLLAPVYGWFTEGFGTKEFEGSEAAARRVDVSGPRHDHQSGADDRFLGNPAIPCSG
jgi:hypothetical protein